MTFKALNWTPVEMVGEAKMDQVADNAEWLFLNTPRAVYTLPGGIMRAEGVKIASGRITIPKSNSDRASADVTFGNFFTTTCQPNITIAVVSVSQTRIFCTVSGIGTILPSSAGFRAHLKVDANKKANDKFTHTTYVSFSAMGY